MALRKRAGAEIPAVGAVDGVPVLTSKTQEDQILAHLARCHSLTPLEALTVYGCFRLSARIFDLRKRGWEIESRSGRLWNGKRVAEYRMKRR
jgi:Helix-turn-helix domain